MLPCDVALLTACDLSEPTGNAPFATAAFDLAPCGPVLLHHGMQDWIAFLSPAQGHLHGVLSVVPLSWGALDTFGVAPCPGHSWGYDTAVVVPAPRVAAAPLWDGPAAPITL